MKMNSLATKMKINEKNLCAYAVAPTPVDKEGYLQKKSDVNKNFQKRYCVLKGNLLFYFDKKGDKEPVGLIILEGYSVELEEDEQRYCFKIVFHCANNRTYVFAAENQESMEQWMKALACAGYDYMKLMVQELRRQLETIDDPTVHSPAGSAPDSPVPPPRQRHLSPYPSRSETTVTQQRSHSMRSVRLGADDSLGTEPPPQSRASISFKELHNSYGRPILTDYHRWRHDYQQAKEKVKPVDNLISL